jgi:hypothetical protein
MELIFNTTYLGDNANTRVDTRAYVRSQDFMAAKVDKIFLDSQTCHLIKNYRRFRDHICPHHQGLMIGLRAREGKLSG